VSYTERKAVERRDRPLSVPNGGAPQRPAMVSPAKPQQEAAAPEGPRFAPGSVVGFSLGTPCFGWLPSFVMHL